MNPIGKDPGSVRFIIITPVRNEEMFVEHALRSVVSQSVLPVEWIIVDDGSSDGTKRIIETYARDHRWIRLVCRKDRGYAEPGRGIIEAFYDGLNAASCQDYDFLVKLDGDLFFDADYFREIFIRFLQDRKLGIAGGSCYYRKDGREIPEKNPQFHVRGATKVYRRECWKEIGGLYRSPGWDTLDEVKANMLGWKTRTFDEIKFFHCRQTSTASGTLKGLIKDGIADYFSGYHPLFMTLKVARRMFKRPFFLTGVYLAFGYVSSMLRGMPRVDDRELIRYLRKQQLRKIFLQETIWK